MMTTIAAARHDQLKQVTTNADFTSESEVMRRGFTLRELLVVLAIIFVLIGLLLPSGKVWPFHVPFLLALGWIGYLWRVIPQLNPDPWTVGTAIACLVGVIVGSHLFLRWLAGRESPWPLKRTLRCVGLIVLMFVAGIAVVGMIHQTSWLARSPEPLIQSRGGARAYSANNLKQMGVSAQARADDKNELPRSTFTADGQPLHSWQTALLPYIEQDQLYKQIDHTKPWAHPANAGPLSTRIRVYQSPSFSDDTVNGFGVSHYAGNVAVVLGDPKKLADFGASTANTLLAGEVSSNFRAWGDPLNARDPRQGMSGHPQGFGAPGRRPTQFVMLDGSVRTFNPQELAELMGNW
jgi:prepilin-type N-terminal cleavage/methylation domain-containing protein